MKLPFSIALLLVAGLAAAPVRGADRPSASSVQQADIAADWRDLLEKASFDQLKQTEDLAGTFWKAGSTVDADVCRKQAKALDEALQVNRVSLSIWYTAYLCAQALHDDALADARLARFAALVEYATTRVSIEDRSTPIQVLNESDVEAFILASGQQLLYAYYDFPSLDRFLGLNISLYDEKTGRERLLYFDFLNARARIAERTTPLFETPIGRREIARALIKNLSTEPDSWATPTRDIVKTLGNTDLPARMQELERLARQEHFYGAMSYALVCGGARVPGCDETSVELILPWAEKKYAWALITLSTAYAEGRGVAKNPAYAAKLLAAADDRLGESRATLFQAALAVSNRKSVDPSWGRALQRAAAAKDPAAEVVLAELKLNSARKPDAAAMSMLGDAARQRVPRAEFRLGELLLADHKTEDGLAWIVAAADAGFVDAQLAMAKRYEHGDLVPKDAALARHWYAEAGRGGDVGAMRWMADDYAARQQDKEARSLRAAWLESAMGRGDVSASLTLARLYSSPDGEAIGGSEENAAAILRSLDKRHNSADARRELASLLLYAKKLTHDPAEARRLLQVDADKGDVRSRAMLASEMHAGSFGAGEVEAGLAAMKALSDEGNPDSMIDYGAALYYGHPPRRSDGLAIWQKAADKGVIVAINNVAWTFCTAPDPALLDGARGMAVLKPLQDGGRMSLAARDTLAACQALTGDFDAALQTERAVLDDLERGGDGKSKFAELARQRIVLYQAHKHYTETEPLK